MNNVVQFVPRSKRVASNSQPKNTTGDPSIDELVNEDIYKMCEATGLSHEEAIKMARDFYKRYPFLIEYVRDMNNFKGGSNL